jgi:acetyl esterase/lipase
MSSDFCNLLTKLIIMRYYLLLLSLVVIACQKETADMPGSGSLPASNILNVAYGTDVAQKMDIYLPAGRTSTTTKVMVLIHGGAWATGDKTDFASFVDSLQRRLPGYAIFNINYRLSTGTSNSFPAQENDTKAALEFIYSKRDEYKISDKFVLLGASAGGHLALLQGYKYSSPVKVKAIVSFFGPTDMTDLYNNPASPFIPAATIAQIVGATPTSNPALYQQSSPINFVTAQSPPTILLHGGLDPLVSPSQAVALDAKLQLAGVIHQYVFYPTEAHGWVGDNLVHSFNQVQAFLTGNVQ